MQGAAAVRQTNVFAGEIIAMPPSGAAFSSGMMICAHPELNVPMTPMTASLPAYAFPFAEHFAESHLPAWAVESSHDW